MPKIDVNGIALHYISVGRGPDLVMVHGFLGNQAVWHLQIVPKLRRHFRITTYDLRGHGYSDVTASGYTADDMAGDLRALLDALSIEKAHLVGHSFGADICMYFAHRFPARVDRLVAIEPGLAALLPERKDHRWPGWRYWVSKLEEMGITVPPEHRADLDYLLRVTLETPKFFGPARGLPRRREPLLHLLRNTTLTADYEVVGTLTKEAVTRIQVPTLLVYGDKSHFLGSYEFLKGAMPGAESELLAGGEHFGPLEQPAELTRHLCRFLEVGDNPSAPGRDVTMPAPSYARAASTHVGSRE